jgi:hypothetical protein
MIVLARVLSAGDRASQNNDHRLIHVCFGSTFEFRRKKWWVVFVLEGD